MRWNRNSTVPLETFGVVASWDADARLLDVWASVQMPQFPDQLARALRLASNQVRVHFDVDVGGSYGVKRGIKHAVLAGHLSALLHAPVKLIEDRAENSRGGDFHGPDRIFDVELACTSDGDFTGIRIAVIDDEGAFPGRSPLQLAKPIGAIVGPYRIGSALVAAAAVLPPSPQREARLDVTGAVTLGLGITGLLLMLAEGPVWGWASPASLACAAASAALLAGWAVTELRAGRPLIDLRLLRHRPVLAANVTAFAVAVGFYPVASLVVRYVQTPPVAGYGFGVGCVYAVNPLQITGGVPAAETGSAISFYQLVRTVAYSLGSTLSATVLVLYLPRGRVFPDDAGYSAAAVVCAAMLVAALAASALFAIWPAKPGAPGRPASAQSRA